MYLHILVLLNPNKLFPLVNFEALNKVPQQLSSGHLFTGNKTSRNDCARSSVVTYLDDGWVKTSQWQ